MSGHIIRTKINPLTQDDRVKVLIVDDSLYSRACSKVVEYTAVDAEIKNVGDRKFFHNILLEIEDG
ncbi:hypothetical protein MA20_48350 [Bradyrhizobium japonicum]|uniref:Uncharacterized protein n=1 Tax=Bradyrhizobium japonicum TaxID=375 RepID=A0A0A3XEB0_BRAJP|nr:hypothetical protein MA20_48350 [Bradyrhizobium japonicum]